MARPTAGVVVLGAAATVAVLGCAGSALPDPRGALAEYARAAERNDATAVHALLTEDARRAYGLAGTQKLLNEGRGEIVGQARAMASPTATVRAVAEVRYVDGEVSVLVIEDGRYRISGAAGLPAGARTPSQALGDLRGALSRRSYPALVRLLSSETRTALEGDVKALVSGLERPDTLSVKVHGETAEVEVPGGHKVLLKREAGVWRVFDLD
jgi:hypothetical protein